MIQKIRLNNIQSHQDTTIEFHKGVNCIVGSSDKGKSSVIRGLLWAIENRPLGVEKLGSHWIFNDKGKQIEPMSVTVIKDDKILVRRRTKDENQYIVEDKVLNVVKSDVPQEVSDFFRLSSTNIQRQLDSPFLLSQTNGEVARYFNSMVKLDSIDKVLTKIESEKRRIRNEIEVNSKRYGEIENKLSSIPDFSEVMSLLASYERLEKRYADNEETASKLYAWLKTYEDNEIDEKYDCLSIEKDVYIYEGLEASQGDIAYRINALNEAIERYEECSKEEVNLSECDINLMEYDLYEKKYEQVTENIEFLKGYISHFLFDRFR